MLTDSGRCFSFNDDLDTQLHTSATGKVQLQMTIPMNRDILFTKSVDILYITLHPGAKYGLSLTLNVESYEKVYSNTNQTGAKVNIIFIT